MYAADDADERAHRRAVALALITAVAPAAASLLADGVRWLARRMTERRGALEQTAARDEKE